MIRSNDTICFCSYQVDETLMDSIYIHFFASFRGAVTFYIFFSSIFPFLRCAPCPLLPFLYLSLFVFRFFFCFFYSSFCSVSVLNSAFFLISFTPVSHPNLFLLFYLLFPRFVFSNYIFFFRFLVSIFSLFLHYFPFVFFEFASAFFYLFFKISACYSFRPCSHSKCQLLLIPSVAFSFMVPYTGYPTKSIKFYVYYKMKKMN